MMDVSHASMAVLILVILLVALNLGFIILIESATNDYELHM